jgi:hypothetical protein
MVVEAEYKIGFKFKSVTKSVVVLRVISQQQLKEQNNNGYINFLLTKKRTFHAPRTRLHLHSKYTLNME